MDSVGPILAAENLHRRYLRGGRREVHALRGVSLSLAPGSFSFVVGRSGSGKSTLLHLLGALDRPTQGVVRVEGRDLAELHEEELSYFRRRRVGFVFQAHNLLSGLTALENVWVPLLPEGISAGVRERAAEILDRVGLSDRKDHVPSQLSGGEQQRVALARALLKRPLLVLADEPAGELDTQTAREIFDLMRGMHRDGVTFLIVTHDPRHIQDGDGYYRMEDGLVVESRDACVPVGGCAPGVEV